MLNGDKLAIFDFFKVDKELPKWKSNKNENHGMNSFTWSDGAVGGTISGISLNSDDIVTEFQNTSISYLEYLKQKMNDEKNISFMIKMKYNLLWLFTSVFIKSKTKKTTIEKTYTIEEFFKTIKNSKMEMNKTKDILEKYEKVLLEARNNKQQALVERLLLMKDVVSAEARLIENKITKYVTEGQVVKLYKNTESSKKLKLTYLENFIRIIPSDIIKLKEKADEICVFDNYVILHFDPLNNSTDLTEKEREEIKSKDPILFGIIQNSRKLYFIGDWVDEYCDLTLDKMMEIISDKELKLTNKSVISYINSI